jgi:hypothetical protein
MENIKNRLNTVPVIVGLLILLTSCRFNIRPAHRTIDYEDPKSELIKTLLTEKDISNISQDFLWHDMIFTQGQELDPDSSSQYENAQSAFFGSFQNSDQTVMLFHTINKYNSLIDKNKPTIFLLSGYETLTGVTTYIPDVSASGLVASKCIVIPKEAKRVCDVHVTYNYTESGINLTTRNLGDEEILDWLNTILVILEPRIIAQDVNE